MPNLLTDAEWAALQRWLALEAMLLKTGMKEIEPEYSAIYKLAKQYQEQLESKDAED